MSEEVVRVDARGKACPLPVVMTIKALEELGGAGTVVTTVDNETAVSNLKNMAAEKGASVEVAAHDDVYDLTFVVGEDGLKGSASDAVASCGVAPVRNVVVQITSDKMGEGDEQLGRQLMTAYVFALTQLEELPQTILFYNGGAKLTCEGSPCLEDLEGLQEAGVKIMTCGTCLNHYGIADTLKVGEVTNMYSIAETLNNASLVVRP
ncbi:MAG: sulfurtransferase-like selenium metabolism protein YedF [Parafannyhessea umbonata]|uniref:sulfurtransferase-like selenium metabolism protein YedF n=1 Tax=Parafannyhessea umbonata TaxID=604330 RepID=UPI0026E95C73|nr:sulfurtransferase-like selenium metabolism protein YedF [Parafannyhessea umbonata]MDD6359295.1 sulfurtransferase-like selenium metabolism protein YedF [Parafannyhessea umbonata]